MELFLVINAEAVTLDGEKGEVRKQINVKTFLTAGQVTALGTFLTKIDAFLATRPDYKLKGLKLEEPILPSP